MVLQLIRICKLPVERYFNPSLIVEISEQRERVNHKLQLCPEKYLPIIEATIDGAIKLDEYRETELAKKLSENLHHVDGTCVEFLSRKKRADNTSGHTGVYITKDGKFRASITFKKKRYHLGIFDTVEDALKARKRGEEMHEDFLEKYYKMHPEQIEKKQNKLYNVTENAE